MLINMFSTLNIKRNLLNFYITYIHFIIFITKVKVFLKIQNMQLLSFPGKQAAYTSLCIMAQSAGLITVCGRTKLNRKPSLLFTFSRKFESGSVRVICVGEGRKTRVLLIFLPTC